jgi:hypothetical protein
VHRPAVDGLVLEAGRVMAERQPQAAQHRRAAVGNRDPAADARRPQRLATLQHAEQALVGGVVQAQQGDELGEDLVLGGAAEPEGDRLGCKEVGEVHAWPRT